MSNGKNNSLFNDSVGWAGIASAVIALIALIVQVVRPQVVEVTVIAEQAPYYTLFLFVFAIVAMTYYLIAKLLNRIGDVNIGGDVVMTNNIGDYVSKNINGIDRGQLETILDAVSKREDLQPTLDRMVDNMGDQNKLATVERLLKERTDLMESEQINKILNSLSKK